MRFLKFPSIESPCHQAQSTPQTFRKDCPKRSSGSQQLSDASPKSPHHDLQVSVSYDTQTDQTDPHSFGKVFHT